MSDRVGAQTQQTADVGRRLEMHAHEMTSRMTFAALFSDVLNSQKRFVYILRSIENPERRYIGVSSNVAARLNGHNGGQDPLDSSVETLD